MAQNINPIFTDQSNSVKQNEETTNRSKDNHAVSKRYQKPSIPGNSNLT